jgi:hypothetical protein
MRSCTNAQPRGPASLDGPPARNVIDADEYPRRKWFELRGVLGVEAIHNRRSAKPNRRKVRHIVCLKRPDPRPTQKRVSIHVCGVGAFWLDQPERPSHTGDLEDREQCALSDRSRADNVEFTKLGHLSDTLRGEAEVRLLDGRELLGVKHRIPSETCEFPH